MKISIESENGTTVAKLGGEINQNNVKSVMSEIDHFVITTQPDTLIMDLAEITFIDSSGIGLIIGRYKLMREYGGQLVIRSPQPYIWRILNLSGIERIVKIV